MYQSGPETNADSVTDMLYQRHAASIFTYVRQHTFSREDAEDIVVDTFLAAMENRKFAQLPEQTQVSWLWRAARNKVIDVYRRAKVRRSIPLELISETVYEDEERGPEQTALRQDEEKQVLNLLKSLPPGQQEIMQLRFGHGLCCAEIAAIVGKHEPAVRTTLSRAMNLLRDIYKDGKEEAKQ